MKKTFAEIQKFRQWWLWVLISPLIILPAIAIIQQLILGKPWGSKPLSDLGVVLFSLFCLLILSLFLFMQLKTSINDQGITMKYRPFLNRHYNWHDIERLELINYGFVGYGFRWWPKHGWIYNVGGNMGLKIYLKSGKHVTIGTQKAEELSDYLIPLDISYSSATV